MNFITKCDTCGFFEGDCEIGLHKAPGYLDNIITKKGETYLEGKICPYHTTSKDQQFKNDRVDSVGLQYVLILTIDDSNNSPVAMDNLLKEARTVCRGELPPREIYFVDNRTYIELGYSYNRVVETIKDIGVPVVAKRAINPAPTAKFVDEYVMTKRLKFPFYLWLKKPCDQLAKVLGGLNLLMYNDMLEVMLVEDEDFSFALTYLHLLVNGNFSEYLKSKDKESSVYSKQEVLVRAGL